MVGSGLISVFCCIWITNPAWCGLGLLLFLYLFLFCSFCFDYEAGLWWEQFKSFCHDSDIARNLCRNGERCHLVFACELYCTTIAVLSLSKAHWRRCSFFFFVVEQCRFFCWHGTGPWTRFSLFSFDAREQIFFGGMGRFG